jgi:hypothetical protein
MSTPVPDLMNRRDDQVVSSIGMSNPDVGNKLSKASSPTFDKPLTSHSEGMCSDDGGLE